MDIQRCPVCGWPAPKGRACPRGCASTDYAARSAPAVSPPQTVAPQVTAAVYAPAAYPAAAPVAPPVAAPVAPHVPPPAVSLYGQTSSAISYQSVIAPVEPVTPVVQPPAPQPAYQPAPQPLVQQTATPVAYAAAHPAGAYPAGAVAPALYPGQDDPQAQIRRSDSRAAQRSKSRGIGGYLVLPIIGLFITICLNAWYLYQDYIPIFGSSTWDGLTNPASQTYHWLWQPLILFGTFAAIIMTLAPIALLVLIFRRRRSTPRFMVAFYAFCCVAGIVDAAASFLVVGDWLRSFGLNGEAQSLTTDSMYTIAQVLILAAIWIPYFLRSRRVKSTFVEPQPKNAVDPAYFMAAANSKRQGNGRIRGALAVLGIVVIAAGAVFVLNTFETTAAGSADTTPAQTSKTSSAKTVAATGGSAATYAQQADTAYTAGDLARAALLYSRAVNVDPTYETAYHGKWTVLIEQKDYAAAGAVALTATQLFPTSRLAWFESGFSQEAGGDLKAAAASYTECLKYPPQAMAATGATLDDTLVQKRLDLVAYVTGISAPRVAIAAVIDPVNGARQQTSPSAAAIAAATTAADSTIATNVSVLGQITPPAHFVDFHKAMLTAYGDIRSACMALAAAATAGDSAALTAAQASLDSAIDNFNANDELAASLMESYYQQ